MSQSANAIGNGGAPDECGGNRCVEKRCVGACDRHRAVSNHLDRRRQMGCGGGTDTATEIGIADHAMVLHSRESILGAGALSWGASLCAGVHSHPHP